MSVTTTVRVPNWVAVTVLATVGQQRDDATLVMRCDGYQRPNYRCARVGGGLGFSASCAYAARAVSNSGNQLARIASVPELVRLEVVADRARDYLAAARAPITLRAYVSDWRHFTTWCSSAGVEALPAMGDTLALYWRTWPRR